MGHAARVLVAGVAMSFSPLAPSPAHAAVPTVRCVRPAGSDLVRTTSEAVVTVEKRSSGGDPLVEATTRTWRGCFRARGVQVTLDSGTTGFGGGHSASAFRLAGAFVAFVARDYQKADYSDDHLTVVDLDSGDRWTSEATTGFAETAVNRRGAAAWIRTSYDAGGHMRWLLFARRPTGSVALRYRSSLPLSDLQLTDRRLRWRENTKVRAVEL